MKADVLVIGAGLFGAHAAVQLVERGLSGAIVDPGPPGGGSRYFAALAGDRKAVPNAAPPRSC